MAEPETDLKALTEQVARLSAESEIRQLPARYALAIDSRDMEGLHGLFVPGVEGEVGEMYHGQRGADHLARLIGMSQHLVGNHIVEFDDAENAHGSVYCRAFQHEDGVMAEAAIFYEDRYQLHEGRWLFERRKLNFWWSVPTAEQPRKWPAADWPRSMTGRGTLPQSWPAWQRFFDGDGPAEIK